MEESAPSTSQHMTSIYNMMQCIDAKNTEIISKFKSCILEHKYGNSRVISYIKDNISKNGKNVVQSVDDITDKEWLRCPFWAIQEQRLDILELCFSAEPDIGSVVRGNKNLLMFAVSRPVLNEEIISFLVDKRHIDVNFQALGGPTALSICLKRKKIPSYQKLRLTKYLLHAGARAGGIPPLKIYVLNLLYADANIDDYWKEIIDALICASQSIDEGDYLQESALMAAVSYMPDDNNSPAPNVHQTIVKPMTVVRYMLAKGADPNLADISGNTSMHCAVSKNVCLLKLLMKYGGKTAIKNRNEESLVYEACLHWECEKCYGVNGNLFPILEELINAGCDVNSKAMDMTTVLHYAAAQSPAIVVQFLCEHGADVSETDYLGRTPLHMTSGNDNPGIVQCLSNFDANLNATNTNKYTPLHIACHHNNLQVATALIELGANVEAVGELGIRPIHLAAENGNADLLKALISCADMTAVDEWGANPLHYAASMGNRTTVKMLLEMCADKMAVDAFSKTPLDYALYRGYSLTTAKLLANNPASVRFGNLPPHIFHTGHVSKKKKLERHFKRLIEAFEKDCLKGVDLAKSLLCSPGLGHIDLDKEEAKLISEKMTSMVKRTVQRVGELDPVFEATLMGAGSTFEGVKTGFPDEYDFLCRMEKFSKHIEKTEETEAKGFAKITMKEESPPEILAFCLRSNRVINAAKFLRHFRALAQRAMYEILGEGDLNIYPGNMLLQENANLHNLGFIMKTKLFGQTMSLREKEFKQLDISVDINPVLFFPSLPQECVQKCCLLGEISSRGIFLIPKHFVQTIIFPTERVPSITDLWRYSTHHIEAEIMRGLPRIGRECYAICKLLRMSPLTCGVKYTRCEKFTGTADQLSLYGESADITDDEDGDIDDNDVDMTGKMNIDGDDDNNDDKTGSEDSSDSEEDTDDDIEDKDLHTVKMQFPKTKDDLNAESCIPSYYLKSIFIKEAEALYKAGKQFTETSLTEIPLRVYHELFKACKRKSLSTLFLPEHNMLKQDNTSREGRKTRRLRRKYCRKIIWLMLNLGFDEI